MVRVEICKVIKIKLRGLALFTLHALWNTILKYFHSRSVLPVFSVNKSVTSLFRDNDL